MKKFEVTMTCVYNGSTMVEAENADKAIEIVKNALNDECIENFPYQVDCPLGNFTFGDITADFADEIEED